MMRFDRKQQKSVKRLILQLKNKLINKNKNKKRVAGLWSSFLGWLGSYAFPQASFLLAYSIETS